MFGIGQGTDTTEDKSKSRTLHTEEYGFLSSFKRLAAVLERRSGSTFRRFRAHRMPEGRAAIRQRFGSDPNGREHEAVRIPLGSERQDQRSYLVRAENRTRRAPPPLLFRRFGRSNGS